MFDGSRGHHSWSERELYMHCSFIVWLFTIFKELQKKKFVTIAAIFHKRPWLASIGLKVDHICIISIKWQLAFYRILKYVF